MSADVRLESYLNLTQGCCPNLVYAVVFNHSHQALKLVSGAYQFVTFASASLNDFKINLTEHPERPRYYYADITAVQFAQVPANPPDEPYWVEYWLKNGVGGRGIDILQTVERFWWRGLRRAYAPLAEADKQELHYTKAHVAVGYDSANHLLRFVAWLEKRGLVDTTAQSCTVKWLTRSGLTIANFTIPVTLLQMPGVFQAQQAITDIDPDEVMPIQVTITDAAGSSYVTNSAVTTWD